MTTSLKSITTRTQARAAQAERERDIDEAVRISTTKLDRYDYVIGHSLDISRADCSICVGIANNVRNAFKDIQNQRAAKPKG